MDTGVMAGLDLLVRDVEPVRSATCSACLRELFDPANRRHRFPFIACAACGPRAGTASASMCPACLAEYRDPAGRRFGSASVSCMSCGPRLRFLGADGDAALRAAVGVVGAGGVVVTDRRLVCDAVDEAAVLRLRAFGGRDPLTVMARDLMAADALGVLTRADRELLADPSAPVVTVPRRTGVLSWEVCRGAADVRLLLPYTPLHHLMLDGLRHPLVLAPARDGAAADGVLTAVRPT